MHYRLDNKKFMIYILLYCSINIIMEVFLNILVMVLIIEVISLKDSLVVKLT